MAKDRAHDPKRRFDTGALSKMGAALGWKREESTWADNLQMNSGQSFPQNSVKESRPHDNSSINKHHKGDFKKDRNEVYNIGGGHVQQSDDNNEYKLNG
jgi:hypothetical protein